MDVSTLYGTRAWQVRALDAYDEVPESHSTAAFIAACLSRLRFRLGWLGDDDEPGPVWDDEGKVNEGIDPAAAELGRQLIRTIRAKIGGQERLLAKIGANLAQVGEVYLVPRDNGGRRYFDAYSIDELRPQQDGSYIRYSTPGRQTEVFRPVAGKAPLVIRVHREHIRYSGWADAATRSLLPTLEVMSLLTQELHSSTVSRIMGPGILWVSEDADLPPDPNDPNREGLTAQLAQVGGVAIRDKSSAAAHVPVIVRVPQDVVEKGIKETKFSQGDLNTIAKRDSAVATFARGSELPVEQILGVGGTSHWNAWQIDESTAKIYINPLMEILCAILLDAYLAPSLALAIGRQPDGQLPPEYAGFVVDYDDSNLVIHPDRSTSADSAFGTARQPNFAISEQEYRNAKGFPESAAPDPEEVERRMAWAERLNARVTLAAPEDNGTGLPDETGPGTVQPGPPPPKPPPASNGNGPPAQASIDPVALARVSAAVELAAERAVDRLGARLRSAANASMTAEQFATIQGRPACELPALLGPTASASLIAPDQQFTGEFAALERLALRWMNGSPRGPVVASRIVLAAEALARALAVTPQARLDPSSLTACLREDT